MADVTLSQKFADGTIYRASGWIDIQSWSNQDNKLTMAMYSRDNSWALFAGSGDVSGSPKQVSVAGVTYNVIADDDITMQPSEYKNEVVVTSGTNLRKMTKQPRDLTGITITANAKEIDALRLIAEG